MEYSKDEKPNPAENFPVERLDGDIDDKYIAWFKEIYVNARRSSYIE